MPSTVSDESALKDKLFSFVRENSIPFSLRESELYLKDSPALGDFLKELGVSPAISTRFRSELSGNMARELSFWGDKARYQQIADVEMSRPNSSGTLLPTSFAAYGPNFSLSDIGDFSRIKIAPKDGAFAISPDMVGLVSITLDKLPSKDNDATWAVKDLLWDDGTTGENYIIKFEGNTLSPETLKAAIETYDMQPLPEDWNPEPDEGMEP